MRRYGVTDPTLWHSTSGCITVKLTTESRRGLHAARRHNEQTKLFAAALDRAGSVCVAVGTIQPVYAFLAGPSNLMVASDPALIWKSAACWGLAALVLRLAAQYVLESLRE